MKAYNTNDGERIDAANDHDLLEKLYKSSRTPAPTFKEFKEELAVRVEKQTGYQLASLDDQDVVKALLAVGLIKEIVS